MKQGRYSKLLLGLALVLALNVGAIIPAAAAATVFTLAADKTEVRQGDTVTLTLSGAAVNDLYAYEAELVYDPQVVELTDSQTKLQGFAVSPKKSGGNVTVAFTKSGDVPGENGDVVIHTFTFKALTVGQADIRLTSVETIDSQLTRFDHYAGNTVTLDIRSSAGTGGGNSGSNDRSHELGQVSAGSNSVTLKIDAARMENAIQAAGNEVVIDLTSLGETPSKTLDIPAAVLNRIFEAGKEVVVRSGKVRLVLTPDSLKQDGLAASVIISIHNEGKFGVQEEGVSAATDTFDITIRSGAAAAEIAEPIEVIFELGNVSDPRKAGVYYLNESSGDWEYQGGKINEDEGTIAFRAKHFSRYAALVYEKTFTDVSGGHWAKDYIEVLASKHIIKGVDLLRFAPERSITRAEFAVMALRLLGLPEQASSTAVFKDVPAGSAYAGAIAAANEAGIMQGDGTWFRPSDKITRQEIAAVAMRVYKALGLPVSGGSAAAHTFADGGSIASWAQEPVQNAQLLGIMQGKPGNLFAPLQDTTRAEAAAIFYRLLDKSGRL